MLSLLTFLVVLVLSILVTRIATLALVHTGLSSESARLQARSAFTGVGFTTSEAEKIVRHPVRRRIVMLLMLLGNAGMVTAVSSLLLTFLEIGEGDVSSSWRLLILAGGIALLWLVARSPWIDRSLSRLINRALTVGPISTPGTTPACCTSPGNTRCRNLTSRRGTGWPGAPAGTGSEPRRGFGSRHPARRRPLRRRADQG